MKKIISFVIVTMLCIGKTVAQTDKEVVIKAKTLGSSKADWVAQTDKEVVIKAGTIVSLQSINQVKTADVEIGQMVDFRVIRDVMVDGVCAIPSGTLVKGKVTEAKKSSVAGTKGRLGINISYLNLPSGTPIYFSNTNILISGKNRTPFAVIAGLFIWPCIFIPGTKAVMPAGYEVQATIAANTTISGK